MSISMHCSTSSAVMGGKTNDSDKQRPADICVTAPSQQAKKENLVKRADSKHRTSISVNIDTMPIVVMDATATTKQPYIC